MEPFTRLMAASTHKDQEPKGQSLWVRMEVAHRSQWAVAEVQLECRTMQPRSKSISSPSTSRINNSIPLGVLLLIVEEVDLEIQVRLRVNGGSQIF